MPKIQHVYLEVMPNGMVMEGVPAGNDVCAGCEFDTAFLLCLYDGFPRCYAEDNPTGMEIIYKDTGKRVRK